MADQLCRLCGAKITTMAFQGTGACCERHLETLEALAADEQAHASFTCPTCGTTSFNPNDVREGYCGQCHAWTRGQPEPRWAR